MENHVKAEQKDDRPQIMLVPNSEDVESDIPVKPIHIVTIYDTAQIFEPGFIGAVVFEDLKVLDMVLKHPDIFPGDITVMSGYPGGRYDAPFEMTTTGLEKISYDSFVIELSHALRQKKLSDQQLGAAAGVNPAQRKSGYVKPFNDFKAEDDSPEVFDED